jgi:hypothetical protein
MTPNSYALKLTRELSAVLGATQPGERTQP